MGVIVFPSKSDYSGRTLALNLEKIRKFQCHNFYLGPRTPYAVVPQEASMEVLHQAVLDGRLIDITDSAIKGIKTENFQLEQVKEDDNTGKRVYFIAKKFKNGETGVVMVTPKDAEQAKLFDSQITLTGKIDLTELDEAELDEGPSGLTPVQVTEVPSNLIVMGE